jgi:hypothetical protein
VYRYEGAKLFEERISRISQIAETAKHGAQHLYGCTLKILRTNCRQPGSRPLQ